MPQSRIVANLLSAKAAKASTQDFSNYILHCHCEVKNIVSKCSLFQGVVSPSNVFEACGMFLQEKTALTVMLPALNAICTLKFAAFSRKQGRKRTCTSPPIIVFSSQMFTLGTIPEN